MLIVLATLFGLPAFADMGSQTGSFGSVGYATGSAGTMIIQTNFNTGTQNTNTYGAPIQIVSSAFLSIASPGSGDLALESPEAGTNLIHFVNTSGAGIFQTNTMPPLVLSNGWRWKFVDRSTGSGSTAVAGNGQIVVLGGITGPQGPAGPSGDYATIAGTATNAAVGGNIVTTNLGLVGSAFKYLKVIPVTEYNSPGTPSFGFKYSPDGTNFVMLQPQSSYLDTNHGIFAPTIVVPNPNASGIWSSNYIVEYDAGANIGPTNIFGLAKSTDLQNWYPLCIVTQSTAALGGIYGGNFYTEGTNLYLYYAGGGNPGGTHTSQYVTWPTDGTMTNWANAVMVADIPSHSPWDPSVIKVNGVYYLAFADPGLNQIHLWTNGISATNTFAQMTADIGGGYSVEGMNFLQLGMSNYVLYVQGTTTSDIGKCYYYTSPDMVNWTGPTEVNETGPITDHGTTIALSPQNQKDVQAIQLQNLQDVQWQKTYRLYTTNAVAFTPVLFSGGNTMSKVTVDALAWAIQNGTAAGETPGNNLQNVLASFRFEFMTYTPGPLSPATNWGGVKILSQSRPLNPTNNTVDVAWQPNVLYTNGGLCLALNSDANWTPNVRWVVRVGVDSIPNILASGGLPGVTTWFYQHPSGGGLHVNGQHESIEGEVQDLLGGVQFAGDSLIIRSNAWNLAYYTNNMENGAYCIASSNGVPVIVTLTGGTAAVYDIAQPGGTIIP